MWTIFKISIEFVTILLLFYFGVFGRKARGICAPGPGTKPLPPALEGKVLNDWSSRDVPMSKMLNVGSYRPPGERNRKLGVMRGLPAHVERLPPRPHQGLLLNEKQPFSLVKCRCKFLV